MTFAEGLGIAANIASVCGIGFVVFQMKRDGSYASASAVTAICSNIRITLEQIGAAGRANDIARFDHLFRNLLNELELASAIVLDRAASARSGKLVNLLLIDVLKVIRDSSDLRERLESAIHSDDTFENLADFLKRHRQHFSLMIQ
ncbi:hypothetical protein HFO24_17045 [Rhizobium laguerreae]|uniref:hypothetical protein n=1 Tax=Rhizobium laguerreae TaxID=1076926 RepID=UPI001C927ECC|nr:hypothetical protein [Rhizobium laguerreae]MBY3183361.1 hypothetical protein [Rhizobium laguerreae]